MTTKVLISLPKELAMRMRAVIPQRSRSKVIRELILKEVESREDGLYKAALAVEKDKGLKKDMEDWDNTSSDGIDDETW